MPSVQFKIFVNWHVQGKLWRIFLIFLQDKSIKKNLKFENDIQNFWNILPGHRAGLSTREAGLRATTPEYGGSVVQWSIVDRFGAISSICHDWKKIV